MSGGLWRTDSGDIVPYIEDGSGYPRLLAVREPEPGRLMAYAPLSEAMETVPEPEVEEFDLWDGRQVIRDQDGRGACMAFSTTWALAKAFERETGTRPGLSEWFLYALINGGADRGATVESAYRAVAEQGTVDDSLVPYGEYLWSRIGREARSAPRWRADRVYRVSSEAELWTAIMRGRPVTFGCAIDQSFSKLDDEGVPAETPWGGRGGHAMTAWGGIKFSRARGRQGARLYRVVNSWGLSWGQGGCCWMTFDQISRGWGLDAFVVLSPSPAPDGSSDVPSAEGGDPEGASR